MPVSNSISKLWKNFTGKPTVHSVNVVAQRFLQAFTDHGVLPSQIPRVLPQIKLDDLKSENTLLAALTPEILDQVAKLFGVRIKWLEGVDDRIYEYRACYKQPELFFELLAEIRSRSEIKPFDFPLRILATSKNLDGTNDTQQLLAPVLVEKIERPSEEPIFRYYIFNDSFDWGYSPTRIQLKAMARMIYRSIHTPVPLFVVSRAEMERILEREMIPHKFLQGCMLTEPSLEDFALSKEESRIAKEVAELPYVMSYIEEHKLDGLISSEPISAIQPSEPAPVVNVPPESATPITATQKIGKRAINTQELWEPVRTTVRAWWAEQGDSLHIAEAIKRIKSMPHLKAASLSDSAIRKHIADLAPLNVRGKSGRKSKKST